MTMTIEQFRATGRDVADLGAEVGEEFFEGLTAGRVYLTEGGPYIERDGDKWALTIENQSWAGEELAMLEEHLFDWCQTSGHLDPLDIIADMARPFGFTIEEGGAMPAFLSCHVGARAVTIGTDGPLEQADPASPLFMIGAMEVEGDYLPEVGNRHPGPLPLAEALTKGKEEALNMGGRMLVEFPDYDPSTLPSIPPHWVDRSWHNEPCPSFQIGEGQGLIVFIDYADPAQREHPETVRFSVHGLDEKGMFPAEPIILLEGDDWEAVLAAVMAHQIKLISARFVQGLQAALTPAQWEEMRRRNASPEYGAEVCASHDFCDANMPMLAAFEDVTGRTMDAGSEEDAALWGAAWDVAKAAFLTA